MFRREYAKGFPIGQDWFIDPAHPLARGLVVCHLPGLSRKSLAPRRKNSNTVGGDYLLSTVVGSPSQETKGGKPSLWSSATSEVMYSSRTIKPVTAWPCTIAWSGIYSDRGALAVPFAITEDALNSNAVIEFYVDASDNILSFARGANAGSSINIDSTLNITNNALSSISAVRACGSTSGTDHTMYTSCNGSGITVVNGSGSTDALDIDHVIFHGFSYNDRTYDAICASHIGCVWNRKLTRSESVSWIKNPYQFFARDIPISVQIAAGGADTIHLLMPTQTSAMGIGNRFFGNRTG